MAIALSRQQISDSLDELTLSGTPAELQAWVTRLRVESIDQGLEWNMRFERAPEKGVKGSWTIFFKSKSGASSSKWILAHPTPLEWVATLIFAQSMVDRLEQELAQAKAGDSIDLNSLSLVDRISNIRLLVSVL